MSPKQQLIRARMLWPDVALPPPCTEFAPATSSEILLLHVPDSFNSLWLRVATPEGYAKHHWKNILGSNGKCLRTAPNKVDFTKPTWVAFDPEHGRGKNPDKFWDQTNIASTEVLSALIQFPDWSLSWPDKASTPSLSGCRIKCGRSWSYVPYLQRRDDVRHLELGCHWSGGVNDFRSSPSVREC